MSNRNAISENYKHAVTSKYFNADSGSKSVYRMELNNEASNGNTKNSNSAISFKKQIFEPRVIFKNGNRELKYPRSLIK